MASYTEKYSLKICTLCHAKSIEHRDALMALDLAAFGNEVAWRDEEFDLSIPGKFELSTVAFKRKKTVGFAIVSVGDDRAAHLHRIGVDPNLRNETIGRMLVAAVEERATDFGVRCVTLECPNALNVAGFYEALGYTRATENMVRDYLMRKNKDEQKELYLPLRSADRLVYSKLLTSREPEG
jgi:ribosomal protein S18 acetylase RimI-like enzyme